MANQILGAYTFAIDPDPARWSGIHKVKKLPILSTLQGEITFDWGFKEWDLVQLFWSSMPASMWDSLYELHIAGDGGLTYTWDPQLESTYTVEIADLDGRQYDTEWYTEVTLTLKIEEEL
jgi:hypothetical protein